MKPIDLLGLGPTRKEFHIESDDMYRITVTPPAWAEMEEGEELLLTPDQYRRYKRWMETGILIQDALPDLSPAEREYLITGTWSIQPFSGGRMPSGISHEPWRRTGLVPGWTPRYVSRFGNGTGSYIWVGAERFFYGCARNKSLHMPCIPRSKRIF